MPYPVTIRGQKGIFEPDVESNPEEQFFAEHPWEAPWKRPVVAGTLPETIWNQAMAEAEARINKPRFFGYQYGGLNPDAPGNVFTEELSHVTPPQSLFSPGEGRNVIPPPFMPFFIGDGGGAPRRGAAPPERYLKTGGNSVFDAETGQFIVAPTAPTPFKPASPSGKLVQDRNEIVRIFGQNSTQVEQFDKLNEKKEEDAKLPPEIQQALNDLMTLWAQLTFGTKEQTANPKKANEVAESIVKTRNHWLAQIGRSPLTSPWTPPPVFTPPETNAPPAAPTFGMPTREELFAPTNAPVKIVIQNGQRFQLNPDGTAIHLGPAR